ncbi:hypothetical protein H7H48_16920 [Nitratireductor sp. B36]|uniref:hypothetical protein n=1 Tax=Nitratireductor sp. B36 TaxID=2762059 RepID=UPI001E2B2A0E|nr:hypothetical protein [Nitratireductor sp. B36]MCC5780747.1 hypothetical protein [Nitratireductor sp. B36]
MSNTANYNWPKPRTPGASQIVEIQRVATALDQADTKAKEISDALAALNAAYDAHTHAYGDLTGRPTTVAGFGITDAYTKTEIDTKMAADIDAAINALINGSPGALDTLQELATAMGNDPNFATTVTNSLATKLVKSLNLSDLPDKATARSNLGLGSAAVESASAFLPAGGKAADSAKLNGISGSTSASGNTYAQRDSSGDISARLFRSEYDSTNGNIGFFMTQIDTGSNNYIRPSTPAQVASALAPELMYSGSAKNNTNFPVGQVLLLHDAGAIRNSSVSVRLWGDNRFSTNGGGAVLSGTWRSRGEYAGGGAWSIMAQRVA